ncbi:MAG: hypothetical protein J7L11_00550 [Thermoprotei archaeon]|nr:hypothetical protein [Thermoprotei archaeon]
MADEGGQIILSTALIVAVLLLSLIVTSYRARLMYLKTRSIVAREVVGAITADFKRALIHVLSLATRAYYNYTKYEAMLSKYKEEGLTLYNKHNFTVARHIGIKYLELWRTFIVKAYAGYGVQVDFRLIEMNLTGILGRPRFIKEGDLMKAFWYYPSSCSVARAQLLLNLSDAGLYGWVSEVTAGLFLEIYPDYEVSYEGNWTEVKMRVLQDEGYPYPYLAIKGSIQVYFPREAYWARAEILNIAYLGNGEYSIKLRPYVKPLHDPLSGEDYVPLLIVVEDDRGILVEGCSYNSITFKVRRMTPDVLTIDERRIYRPDEIAHEVYTLEFTWDLKVRWLGMELRKENLELPPMPFMPIKQLRVNSTIGGAEERPIERPVQYEEWKEVVWHGRHIWVPCNLSDPQMDFGPNTRLVFQVSFPRLSVKEQLVVIWWEDDLDAEPKIYPTLISYRYDATHKDVWHPLYDVEFVDVEHPQSRGYIDYHGVAAIVMRDPVSDYAFGPYNLHAFGIYLDRYLGRYRPYGKWNVYSNYLRYTWIQAPIRIFAVLNTSFVGNVYDENDKPRDNYYDTLAIVQVINGTRYLPILTYIYWKDDNSSKGYWLSTAMGRGLSEWFAYVNLENSTGDTPFSIGEVAQVREEPEPNFMITYWRCSGSQTGKALILSRSGVQLLYEIAGRDTLPQFIVTKHAPSGELQGSIEYAFWLSTRKCYSVSKGTFLAYWVVMFDYKPLGGSEGWLSISNARQGWKNACIYAPMFLEDYAPLITSP